MRRAFTGLAILIGGALGLFGLLIFEQALTNQVLGPWRGFSDWEPPMQFLLLAAVVLPPLLVARALLPRGRSREVGLFLLGWGCVWPVIVAYLVLGTVAARLLGGQGPWIGLLSDPASIFAYLFFAALPLAGLWLITAGLRQRRTDRVVDAS